MFKQYEPMEKIIRITFSYQIMAHEVYDGSCLIDHITFKMGA
jgi:hypothetical protein